MILYVRWSSDGDSSWFEYDRRVTESGECVGSDDSISEEKCEDVFATFPHLDASQTRFYRSVVVRAAYLWKDRPDLSVSEKVGQRTLRNRPIVHVKAS